MRDGNGKSLYCRPWEGDEWRSQAGQPVALTERYHPKNEVEEPSEKIPDLRPWEKRLVAIII